jgi:hypothetical protein
MSTTPSIQPTTPTASYTTNANTATQSQTPGAWYNPFPNPYPYGFPTNGGNMYNPMMGGMMNPMMGGGMMNPMMGGGMMNPMMAGAYGMPTNIYGGYDYQNNNPNSALPGYGYQSAIAPTSFTSPLSGNGVAPNSAGNRIYQEHFAADNAPLVTMASGAVGAFATGMTWAGTIGKSRIFNNKFGIFLQAGITLAGAVAGAVMGNRFMGDKLKAYYTGLDYNENGNMDGSYTSQRGYDVNLLKIL